MSDAVAEAVDSFRLGFDGAPEDFAGWLPEC
jgi:hypothetical protein